MLVSCAPDILVTFEQLSSNDESNKGHPQALMRSPFVYIVLDSKKTCILVSPN